VASPAPRYDDERDETRDDGWPVPQVRGTGPRPAQARTRRRSRHDAVALSLALLGVVAAAAAGLWYLRLDSTPAATSEPVPDVVGLSLSAAVRTLTHMGFDVRAIQPPGSGGRGIVFSQRPGATTTLARGATVTIRVSDAQQPQSAAAQQP
jgi:PASTA domain